MKKAEYKITGFVVYMLLFSLAAGILALSMADLSDNYDTASYTENESLEMFNKLAELHNQSDDIQDTVVGEEDKSESDILGDLFENGYTALKAALNSFNVFNTMSDDAISRANMGQAGSLIKTFAGTAIIIVLFLGIVIAVLVRKNV